MIKTEKLTKLFATEEVQTKALNEVTLQVEVNTAEYFGYTRFSNFRLLFL